MASLLPARRFPRALPSWRKFLARPGWNLILEYAPKLPPFAFPLEPLGKAAKRIPLLPGRLRLLWTMTASFPASHSATALAGSPGKRLLAGPKEAPRLTRQWALYSRRLRCGPATGSRGNTKLRLPRRRANSRRCLSKFLCYFSAGGPGLRRFRQTVSSQQAREQASVSRMSWKPSPQAGSRWPLLCAVPRDVARFLPIPEAQEWPHCEPAARATQESSLLHHRSWTSPELACFSAKPGPG